MKRKLQGHYVNKRYFPSYYKQNACTPEAPRHHTGNHGSKAQQVVRL